MDVFLNSSHSCNRWDMVFDHEFNDSVIEGQLVGLISVMRIQRTSCFPALQTLHKKVVTYKARGLN